MADLRRRLGRLEAGEPEADRRRFEQRRLAAEAAVRAGIDSVNDLNATFGVGAPRDTTVHIENLRQLVAVEKSIAEHRRGEAFVRRVIARGTLPGSEAFARDRRGER